MTAVETSPALVVTALETTPVPVRVPDPASIPTPEMDPVEATIEPEEMRRSPAVTVAPVVQEKQGCVGLCLC